MPNTSAEIHKNNGFSIPWTMHVATASGWTPYICEKEALQTWCVLTPCTVSLPTSADHLAVKERESDSCEPILSVGGEICSSQYFELCPNNYGKAELIPETCNSHSAQTWLLQVNCVGMNVSLTMITCLTTLVCTYALGSWIQQFCKWTIGLWTSALTSTHLHAKIIVG